MYKKLGYLGAFFIVFYYFIKEAIWKGMKSVVKESLHFLLEEDFSDDSDKKVVTSEEGEGE